jgi:sugar lactone lactonase YvrE
VGQSSTAISVKVTATVSGTSAVPTVVMQGVQSADYVATAGGSCASVATTYAANQSCTVTVVFQPKAPGIRSGAVVLRASNGTVLGVTPLSGMATGPLPVLSPGIISTVAGTTDYIYQGDGNPAAGSPIFLPGGVALDGAGNLYVSDTLNDRVRRVDAVTGIITTIAGNGTIGFAGDGGVGTQALLASPAGLAIDGAGFLYVADTGNHSIRRIDLVTDIITTVAGQLGQQGYTGDGKAATSAKFTSPEGVCFDLAGNMIIADTGNNVIRRVNAATGIINTIAGTGAAGYNGDGVLATAATLNTPWGTTVGADGAIYISDRDNHRVRKVDTTGIISTVAGIGNQAYSGDTGPATAAALNEPSAVVMDPAGDLFIADTGNNKIRVVNGATSVITSVAGTGDESFSGDGGPANLARIYGTNGLYLDAVGDLYLTDPFHNRIREISALTAVLQYEPIRVGKLSPPQSEGLVNEGNAGLDPTSFVLSSAQLDTTTTCAVGTLLLSSGSCNLAIIFAPTVLGNPVIGSVTVNSNAASVPVITLKGQVLNVNPTTLTVTSSVNPSQVGQSVTFIATVSSANSAVTGTMLFLDGPTQICSVTITSSNAAACTTSTLTLGSHTITASYSGDSQDESASSQPLIQVVKQSPGLSLSVQPNPAVVNSNVTLTFTATSTAGTPTGSVTFYEGAVALFSANLSGGVAGYSTSQLAVGTHVIYAQYSGDSTNSAGTSNSVAEVITQATTATSLASSNATASVGSAVTFTATVTYGSGSAGTALTGTVQFRDGSTTIGTSPLVNGIATFTTTTLVPGTHNIVAVYSGDTNDSGSSSATLVETIQQLVTTTVLTATVNGATTAGGALTGNVVFTDGATTLSTVAVNASGQAILATNLLSAGSHSIVATYGGSTNYATSTSNKLVEVVNQTATVTALATVTSPTEAGTPAAFTVAVTSQTGIPQGSVNFTDNGNAIGSATLGATGTASFSTSGLSVGTHQIVATYAGSTNYTTSTSSAVQQVVVPAATATALTSSLNPAPVGQTVTFTATISSKSSIAAGGTVSFTDGGTALGSAVVAANGTATFATSSLAFGVHTIVAIYSGDTNHGTSTSSSLSEKIVQPSTDILTSSANPSVVGANVTFTAQIAGVGSVVPTGTVTFSDGVTPLGVVTVNATGAATFQTAALVVGSHPITAAYSGDPTYAVASAALTQVVQTATTQTALTASANPATYAATLTLTATVTSAGSIATGPVTFVDGGTTLGTATLNAAGVATFTTSTLIPGAHSIVANYPGDGRANASSSSPLAISVKETTQAVLTSNANPALALNSIILTTTVTNAGVGVPTGAVTFTDGSTSLGSATLNASGIAALTVPQLLVGTHPITASYAGDGSNFASSAAALNEVVSLRPTATTVSGTAINPNNPQDVLLIGVVEWTGPVVPTGTITFTNNGTVLGTVAVNSAGVATLAVTLGTGTNLITASYSGDVSYAPSSSTATTITGGAATHFSMTLSPGSLTVASKQHGTTTLTLTSISGFSDTLSYGCLGLPFGATCTFSKTQSVLPANGTQAITLTIDTGNPLGAGGQVRLATKPSTVMLCFLPVALLLGLGLKRRRRLLPMLLLLCAMAMTLSATGCGGLTVNGTPPGKYTFDVTASGQGTGFTESQTFTLTVTQ